jgi:hypothetical protein
VASKQVIKEEQSLACDVDAYGPVHAQELANVNAEQLAEIYSKSSETEDAQIGNLRQGNKISMRNPHSSSGQY